MVEQERTFKENVPDSVVDEGATSYCTSFLATEVADALRASLGFHSDCLGEMARLASNDGAAAAVGFSGSLSAAAGSRAPRPFDGVAPLPAALLHARLRCWACSGRVEVRLTFFRSLATRIMAAWSRWGSEQGVLAVGY